MKDGAYIKSILVLSMVIFCGGYPNASDHVRLLKDLLKDYDKRIRPVHDQSAVVSLHMSIDMRYFRSIDNVIQHISFVGELVLRWKDEFLTWNSSQYGGITQFHPDLKDIWEPSLNLVDNLPFDYASEEENLLTVYSDGQVLLMRNTFFQSYCPLDMSDFPFDKQMCAFEFTTSNYFSDEVILTFDEDDNAPLSEKYRLGEWILYDAKYIRVPKNDVLEKRDKINFILKLQRRPLFYILNVVSPIVLISMLNVLVFVVPPESGEKMTFSLTSLLSLAVFMSYITSLIPTSSDKPSLLMLYLTSMLLLSGLSILATAIVTACYHSRKVKPVPCCMMTLAKKFKIKISDPGNESVSLVTWQGITNCDRLNVASGHLNCDHLM
ncbi:acetylcholine receptor subunit alpha-like [Haliotis asinina]|uniref:acetylcholine receptor subunit alpha-like n=1 Tax=Haliotis asinina TaxID=109174 RepID=UPI003532400C